MSLFPSERPISRILQKAAERNDWVHGTIYVQSKRVYIIDDPHCVWRSFSRVDDRRIRWRRDPYSRCGWAGLGGWMTDGVDRVREVWDGLCYQLSRRQACLCDVCAVAPYFIALFLHVLHLWSTTHAAEMGFALLSFFVITFVLLSSWISPTRILFTASRKLAK